MIGKPELGVLPNMLGTETKVPIGARANKNSFSCGVSTLDILVSSFNFG